MALLVNLKFYNYILLLLPFIALNLAWLAVLLWGAAGAWPRRGMVARLALGGLLALALLEGMAGVWRSLRSAAATSSYASLHQPRRGRDPAWRARAGAAPVLVWPL